MQQGNPRFFVINIATGKNARKNSFYLSYQHYKENPIVKMCIEL